MKLTEEQIRYIAKTLEEGMNAYINTETEEIAFIIDFNSTYGDTDLWKARLKNIEDNWTSYIIIEHLSNSKVLRNIERFLDQIENEELKEKLTTSLETDNPHEAFMAIINDTELLKKRWDAFDLKEKERYIRSKLVSEQQSDAEGRQANAVEMEQGSSIGESNNSNYSDDAQQLSVVLLAQVDLNTQYGTWREYLFYDGQKEIIAIVMGEVEEAKALYCRLHSSCIHGHYFNSIECTCQAEMNKSQEMIQQAGQGLIILLDQEGKGNGHLALLNSIHFKRQGMKQADAYVAAGFERDSRSYQSAAHVIKSLGIKSVTLLTSSPNKMVALRDCGVEVLKNIELKID